LKFLCTAVKVKESLPSKSELDVVPFHLICRSNLH